MSLKIFLLLIQTNLFLTLIYQLLVLLQFSCLFFSNCLFSQIWVTLFIPLRAALTIIVYCVLWIFFMQDVFSGLHYWINMFSATHSSFVYYHIILDYLYLWNKNVSVAQWNAKTCLYLKLQKLVNNEDNWNWYGIHNSLQITHRLHSQQGKVNSRQEAKRERIIDSGRARRTSN